MEKSKVIIIDWGMVIHKAGYASKNNPDIPVNYTVLNMMTSYLRKIGVNPQDELIIACDGKGNWRKNYEKQYKANRKKLREKSGLDWNTLYTGFNELLKDIDKGTDWHIIQLDTIEADDIASVACRYFTDKEIILCSFDSDWEMLWNYPNVKIFTPLKKFGGKKGAYKVPPKNFDVYQFLSNKIRKEVSDNLTNPILNEKDYENRMICVNLLELPEFVESQIINAFKNMETKQGNLEYIPYPKMREKIGSLYNDRDKIVEYEKCVERDLKKKRKKRRKK